jgi:hypothetical protein
LDRIVALIYPYEQETALERNLSPRVQVEKHINPSQLDPLRYDKILMVGDERLFNKATVDKISILQEKSPDLIKWVKDDAGQASNIIQDLPKLSQLGAFQSIGLSEMPLTQGTNLTILFKNESPSISVWRMLVTKGGSGIASLSFFDVEFGGKLLRTYDLFLSEFAGGWHSFQLPNPIFKAQKRFAVSVKIKTLVGEPPVWISHQGWTPHSMLLNGTKSDLVCCFETL